MKNKVNQIEREFIKSRLKGNVKLENNFKRKKALKSSPIKHVRS